MHFKTRVTVAIAEFGEQHLQHAGLFGQRAQYIQALHVAGAFPDGIHRRLAIKPRQDGFLDIAGAAEAFAGLGDHGRGALADPVLADGGDQAGELVFVLVTAMVLGAAHAQGQRQRCLAFQGKVGQHVLH